MKPPRQALGRGISTLLQMDDVPAAGSSLINEIPLSQITPNPDQPRSSFSEEALEELASSIRELGIIQPLSLRKIGPDTYQIIAGERRYRAASLAGLTTVPAYIRTADDIAMTEMALIENIQREDLNAIEIALTYKKLIEQYNLTQERLSERVGKKRTTIANFLRLLRLPAEVQLGLRDKRLDMGHARALLSIEDPTVQLKLYNDIIKNGLSVRRVEELARQMQEGNNDDEPKGKEDKPKVNSIYSNHDFDILKKHLSAAFNTNVNFSMDRSGKGKITFPFNNDEELAKLICIFDNINQYQTEG